MLQEAIKPAVPRNIKLDEASRRIHFEVLEDDLSIAIGRRGQNARLTSRLLGWKLDISKEQTVDLGFDERIQAAVQGWHGVPGVPTETAQRLVDIGLINPEAFEGVEVDDLVGAGFADDEAQEIFKIVNDYRGVTS